MYSVRQKVRELLATVTDANTLKREQEMLLANAFRRGGTYVLACVVSVSFLLMHFGFITDRTGVGLIWAWVFVTVVMIFWYGVKRAPAWLWRWLVQGPPK